MRLNNGVTLDAPRRTGTSIVVPVFNEQDSLVQLCERIKAAMADTGHDYEIIFIDDGSTDASPERLEMLAATLDNVKCIVFRRNFGKAAALDAGFDAATGEYIITMDADLQDDPLEIPNFIDKLNEGYDVVSGWKRVRNDPVNKTLPSRVFNMVVSRMSGVKLNDFNCGFKAYRAEALEDLSLYGELHRFIPVLLHWRGYRIGEIPVNHHARQFGSSKYGLNRLLKGGLDLLGVMLNTRFATRPLHIFGAAGAVFGLAGTAMLTYLSILWATGYGPIGDRPLLMLGMLLVMTSFQFLTIGLLGEFIQRQGAGYQQPYAIKTTLNLGDRGQTEAPATRRLAEIARLMRESYPDDDHDNSARHHRAPSRKVQQSKPAASVKPQPLSRSAGK